VSEVVSFSGKFRFLSNFHPSPVTFEGLDYPSVEHAYQAAKTTDQSARDEIRLSATAGAAKKLGRRVVMRPDWESIKLGVMEELVRQKFADPDLKEALLATGCDELIEGNYWGDTFWGVCKGVGHNHLGQILMKVRSELAG